MRTCKTIYNQCYNNPIFWYFLYVHRFPQDFLSDYYIYFVGESPDQPKPSNKKKHADVKYIDKNEVMNYLRPKFEQLYYFEPKLREVSWREIFLQRTIEEEAENRKKNALNFK